jgi:hypothetical protein
MAMMKKSGGPRLIDDNEHVGRLMIEARLPPLIVDMAWLVTAVRNVALAYVDAASVPDDNVVHHEIRALYYAARRRRYSEAARLRDELSGRTRDHIDKRANLPGIPWELPSAAALLDKATREEACATIMSLLSRGGEWREGRRRGGVRTMEWAPNLHAPRLQRHPPKRQAERELILKLALVYCNATGQPAALTTNYIPEGPFLRLAKACLELAGAKGADAVAIIKNLQWRRRSMRELLQLREMRRNLLWELLEFEALEQLLRDDDPRPVR